jgi:hypothetical protein
MAGRGSPGSGDWTRAFRSRAHGDLRHLRHLRRIRAHAFESPGKGGETGQGWDDRGLAARPAEWTALHSARAGTPRLATSRSYRWWRFALRCTSRWGATLPGPPESGTGQGALVLMCRCGDGLDRDQLALGLRLGLRVHQNLGVLWSAPRVPDPKSNQDRHERGQDEGGDCSPQSDQTKL